MKKDLLLFCIVLTISSLFLSRNILRANSSPSGNNDTIINIADADHINISIFPNPVVNNVVTLTSGYDFAEIEILNIVGRSVMKKKFEAGTSKATLNLKQLNNGLYVMRIIFDNRTLITEKIMIK